ncbi:MAG TPA: DUF2089 domain-containing protein [Candidatus Edwardsbacteria bacterium]|nr:DUF2089 domain-containing protein [Candidatus Edwardsbacteria bacterium]
MPKQTPNACPSCGSPLVISELKCTGCDTVVRGEFYITPLGNLSEQQLDFVKTFVLSRGNIREVESKLGISYPTVRAKLDEAIAAISGSAQPALTRAQILDQLESGAITAAQASDLLRQAAE